MPPSKRFIKDNLKSQNIILRKASSKIRCVPGTMFSLMSKRGRRFRALHSLVPVGRAVQEMVAKQAVAKRSVEGETGIARDGMKNFGWELIVAGDHDLEPLPNTQARRQTILSYSVSNAAGVNQVSPGSVFEVTDEPFLMNKVRVVWLLRWKGTRPLP